MSEQGGGASGGATPKSELGRFLPTLVPGVYELRMLNVPRSYGRPQTLAGYFEIPAGGRLEDCKPLTDAVGPFVRLPPGQQPSGIYLTLNPVNPALMARANGKLKQAGKDCPATGDADVPRLTTLLLDADAVRPSGISSTCGERKAAFETAAAVREFLTARGWPLPVLIDSGNGFHLRYRVDLPKTASELLARVMRALAARFDGSGAKIDTAVFNPSRIARLPGTWARKGDSFTSTEDATTSREHRLAETLEVPDPFEPVTLEQLESLVADLAPATEGQRPSGGAPAGEPQRNRMGWLVPRRPSSGKPSPGQSKLMVWEWLKARGVGFHEKENRSGGRRVFVLDVCPFDDAHGGDSAIFLEDSGRTGAKCLHDQCPGHEGGWKAFKERIGEPDPDHYDPPKRPRPAPSAARRTAPPPGYGKSAPVQTSSDAPPPTDPPDDGQQPPSSEPPPEPKMEWDHPVRVANGFLGDHTIGYVKKTGFLYDGRRYLPVSNEYVSSLIWAFMEMLAECQTQAAHYARQMDEERERAEAEANGEAYEPKKKPEIQLAQVSTGTCQNALRSIQSRTHLPDTTLPETWLPGPGGEVPDLPPVLSVANGLLNLKTRELVPHDPRWFSLTTLPAAFDPAAPPPAKFLAMLADLLGDDAESLAALQEVFGACLDRNQPFKHFVVLFGPGDCGKTAVIAALQALLGAGNFSATSLTLLTNNKFAVFDLFGKLANVVDDEDGTDLKNAAALRRLTGGAVVSFEEKNKTPFVGPQTAKLVFSANVLPSMDDGIEATWNRLAVIPFITPVPIAKQNALMRKVEFWADEAAGLLNWALAGLDRLRANSGRVTIGEAAKKAVHKHRLETDTERRFLTDAYEYAHDGYGVIDLDEYVTIHSIFGRYGTWCEANGVNESKRLNAIRLGMRVKQVFDESKKGTVRDDGGIVVRVRRGLKEKPLPPVVIHPKQKRTPAAGGQSGTATNPMPD